MKLKLDLHPIFNDSGKIEAALGNIIDEAVEKRATEIEIIPGKGSGALKKSVLRFLDRPEVKQKYHRVEKDSDNFGRVFVHFRHNIEETRSQKVSPADTTEVGCICCEAVLKVAADEVPSEFVVECKSCGSPNRIDIRADRKGNVRASSAWGYDEPAINAK